MKKALLAAKPMMAALGRQRGKCWQGGSVGAHRRLKTSARACFIRHVHTYAGMSSIFLSVCVINNLSYKHYI